MNCPICGLEMFRMFRHIQENGKYTDVETQSFYCPYDGKFSELD